MNDLSVYVHIPFCARKCRYCSFYSVPPQAQLLPSFFRAVMAELDLYAIHPAVETLYIGGGSPSLIAAEHMIPFLRQMLKRTGPISESTVEINPAQADQELLAQLKDLGVNRLSIGAQSFDQKDLDFLGRLHRVEDIGRSLAFARAAGFDNIGLDLIYAIPGSSVKTWKQTLRQAVDLGAEHISAYSLTFEKGTPLYHDLQSGKVTPVDEDTDRAMYDAAIDTLTTAGFEHYEISNFARLGFQCRHNLRYWDNRPWIGLGPSAASWFAGRRTTNIADLQKYIAAIENGQFAYDEIQTPSATQIACETAVLNLRKTAGINRQAFREQTGFDPLDLFSEPIRKYTALNLLTADSNTIRLTPAALPIANSILCDFVEI
jgi:oxygen-independent coproporphyrinogen-3 oxidase